VVPIDLCDAVGGFSALLRRVIGEDIELEVQRPVERLVVDADATQLEQVLLNLATNARQAMPAGGKLTIGLRRTTFDEALAARHPGAKAGDYAELAVSDNGVGMAPQTLARAFEPFFTTKPGGTGLGLAVVHGIVLQHRGLVDIQSRPHEGTRFSVFLPLAPSTGEQAGEAAPRRAPQLQGGSETVLVAEDEPSLRKMLVTTLRELGYSVIEAGDGEEAARAFEAARGTVDLAILDVVMPKLGGVEACARMRAIAPSLKVVFTTGYAPETAQVSEIVTREGHALLSKPFSLDVLARRVRDVLDGRA
jgi:CheY-like chemotaxis protein